MTTRFSKIAQDWELTDTEVGFLSNVIVQLRKSETLGSGKRRSISFDMAIDAVRAAAADAERQYQRTFHSANLERFEALDAAHSLMLAVTIEFSKIRPILHGYAERKKGATR